MFADIIADQATGADCGDSGGITDDGYNLDSDGTCGLDEPSDLPATDPQLGSLANHGGLTETVLPALDSPEAFAIPLDTTLDGTVVCPRTDQAGVSAPLQGDNSCAIGATEPPLPLVAPPAPKISSLSVASGPASGGTAIVVTGSGFLPRAFVEIGQGHGAGPTAIAATDVVVVSSTEITAVTGGAARTGTFNLFVLNVNPVLTSTAHHDDLFTYVSTTPTVSEVYPATGPTAGGTSIMITGTNFVQGAQVEIAQGQGAGPTAILATDVVVVSSTEITATTGGPARRGTFNVFVLDAGGTSSAHARDDYTYT